MSLADEQIRVSASVKRQLDRRKRADETYNDVLERILDEGERDFLAGFGRWSDEQADRVRKAQNRSREQSKQRMQRLAEDG